MGKILGTSIMVQRKIIRKGIKSYDKQDSTLLLVSNGHHKIIDSINFYLNQMQRVPILSRRHHLAISLPNIHFYSIVSTVYVISIDRN